MPNVVVSDMGDHIDDAEETADSASDPDDDDNGDDDDEDDDDEDDEDEDEDDHDDDHEDEDDEVRPSQNLFLMWHAYFLMVGKICRSIFFAFLYVCTVVIPCIKRDVFISRKRWKKQDLGLECSVFLRVAKGV